MKNGIPNEMATAENALQPLSAGVRHLHSGSPFLSSTTPAVIPSPRIRTDPIINKIQLVFFIV